MSNGRKVLMVFSRDGRLCTKTYTSDGKLAWELEGDMLLKFAVDVAKGDTLVRISGTDVIAEEDYKVGDYLYFSKGTFYPTEIRFNIYDNNGYDYYSEIRFLKGLDISQIKSFYRILGGWGYTITGASKAKIIDVSHFDTKNVTDMHTMFCGCTSVKKLDISGFDTSKVTDMQSMFCNCTSLTSLNVSKFDTSKVTIMGHMFRNCSSLTSLDVSHFDTSKVTTMYTMFRNCTSLTSLNVSNFDTSKVTDMQSMFRNCSSLTSLDVSNFDTSKVTTMDCIFDNCTSLTNLIFGSKWGTQTSTAAKALMLDLSTCGSSKSYKLTDETYNSMLTMYDRASNGLATMTIKFSKRHNLPDGFAEKMSALGYTITLA
jgi:surface protein